MKERAIELVSWATFELVTRAGTVVFRLADAWALRFPNAARRARERFHGPGPSSGRGYGVGRF